MVEFLKVFAYTILGLIAFVVIALFGVWMLILLWPIVIIALPLALIIYLSLVVYKLAKKENKKK